MKQIKNFFLNQVLLLKIGLPFLILGIVLVANGYFAVGMPVGFVAAFFVGGGLEKVVFFVSSKKTLPAKKNCPVCNSEHIRPDYDFPLTITCCNKCGSDWNTEDEEIILDARDFFSDEENFILGRNPKI